MWDAVIALIVVGALVLLVVFLVRHYKNSSDAATILGIAAPVLAAAFGVSLGYWSGEKKGAATGEKEGKNQVADQLKPVLDKLHAGVTTGLLAPVMEKLNSPAGRTDYLLPPDHGDEVFVQQEAITQAQGGIADLEAIIRANQP
jgi:hypothetical protein